ncbi:PAS domain-containing sensor histidine kinase [Hyalangium versicolor]|uniref:PAS domain-containing sensor histidine kinase n=1 Tax=Hyalangium versicolor TaxID=2861190 RepID=UPI001CCE830A|nr:ATP-binding protein [Hyalangium versicolor]
MPRVLPRIHGHSFPQGRPGSLEIFRSRALRWIDLLISEPLRRAPLAERTRARVLSGTTCGLLLFDLLYTVLLPAPAGAWLWWIPGITGCLGMSCALLLLRRARTLTIPAFVLCASMLWEVSLTLALYRNAYASTHASFMLVPAVGVYLLGPRKGLFLALFALLPPFIIGWLIDTQTGLREIPPVPGFRGVLLIAFALSMLSIWLLGAVNSGVQNAAQQTLERALKELGDSERKLSSLFESTDGMMCSLDEEGRVLVVNTAMKQHFRPLSGRTPVVGQQLFAEAEPSIRQVWEERFQQVLQGQHLRFEVECREGPSQVVLDTSLSPILDENGVPRGIVLFSRDITARKEAETRLAEMHRTLVDVSRQAGMAEVATGVLHNVGNALNSVNISAHFIGDKLRKLRVSGVERTATLMKEHSHELGSFLTTDARGQQLPAYLEALAQGLHAEQEALVKEADSLAEGIEHIKAIVSMQQKHAKTVGAVEALSVPQLLNEALRLNATSFERASIRIERDFADVPSLVTDRHKLMQILMNLLTNARHALEGSEGKDRCMRIRVGFTADGEHLLVQVSDNGVGIAPEHLPRLFTQGFTTKKEGHGFGLHVSAVSAKEMKGRLTCASAGLGQGATFTLELPLAAPELPTPGA